MSYTDKINELITEGGTFTFRNNGIKKEHGTFSKTSVKMQAW